MPFDAIVEAVLAGKTVPEESKTELFTADANNLDDREVVLTGRHDSVLSILNRVPRSLDLNLRVTVGSAHKRRGTVLHEARLTQPTSPRHAKELAIAKPRCAQPGPEATSQAAR